MEKSFDISRYVREGWELLMSHFANLIVATLIFLGIQFAIGSLVPVFGGMIVSGPLMGGLFYVILDLRRGKEFQITRMFDGFTKKLVPLVLVGALTSVFITAGFFLLILPGLLISGWYLFPYLFVVDKDMDFWPAMEASREIGFNNHVHVFLFVVVLIVINLLGALAVGIGLLISVPLSMCSVAIAYESLTGAKTEAVEKTPPPLAPPPSPTIPS
ncbi:hypothetical protein MNBD_NITROSPINAE04-732 [hydrothermal vent metagenome]|uniref:Uncharacterized protein n=1 Tax=hydrothermal vent metagenome TaxID=652676 RepID=A0A3B1CI96_9ZZZZ